MVDLICCIPGSICCLVKDSGTADMQNKDTKPKRAKTEEGSIFVRLMDRFKDYNSPLTALVVDYYSPFLQNYIVKAVIIVIFSIWFGITVWGCTTVEDGLDLDDILPEGTVEHSFASANVEHFAAYSFTVVTKDINYSDREVQRSLLQMSEEVGRARYVTLAGGLTANWLQLVIDYYSDLQEFYDTEYCSLIAMNLINPLLYRDVVGIMTTLHLVINPARAQNITLLTQQVFTCFQGLPSLVEVENGTNFTYIDPNNFYPFVALWVSTYIQIKWYDF